MLPYLLRRLLGVVPTVLGVLVLVFVLFNLVGGDPAFEVLGRNATASQIEEYHRLHGLDQPLFTQFFNYLGRLAVLDFGESSATHRPVIRMIQEGLGPSLTLTVPAFLLTTLLGIAVSLFVAFFRSTWVDRLAVGICVLGMSVPLLAFILLGQYFFAFRLGWFPIAGFEPGWPERFEYVALPVLIWVLVGLGYNVRFFRTALLEEAAQDYVRTARAKGLDESRVFLKHVLKNSLAPILSWIVMEIPTLLLGAFLFEKFFSIPGVGSLTIDAIQNSDFEVIKAMTILTAFLRIFGNFLIDALYRWVDPRVILT